MIRFLSRGVVLCIPLLLVAAAGVSTRGQQREVISDAAFSSTGDAPHVMSDAMLPNALVPSITVISPNGGEVWHIGATYDITWTVTDVVGSVTIELVGSSYTGIIGTAEATAGTFSWTITPDVPPGTEYDITIYQVYGSDLEDTSDDEFTIVSDSPYTNPDLIWNTFLGGADYDQGQGVAADASGNVCVVGYSFMTWGSPIRPFAGEGLTDAFVAKLDANGSLLWNTFLGGMSEDQGYGIAVDAGGNCYVTGWSMASWGSPVRPFTTSGSNADAFIAKLDTNGNLLWNTFLGGLGSEDGLGIAVDSSGNSYMAGLAEASWGSPIRPYAGEDDAFVAKVDASGYLQWNTFLGGPLYDTAYGIAVDANGNVFVTGDGETTWGDPVDPFVGDDENEDAYVAKVATNGTLLWNTFMGAAVGDDCGNAIAVDTDGNAYAAGWSDYGWGAPVEPFTTQDDAFVAKFNPDGARQWHSFLGWSDFEYAYGIAVDDGGGIYVAGESGSDTFVAGLSSNGHAQWHTILAGPYFGNSGGALALDENRNCYVVGSSTASWGTPLEPFHGGYSDAFVAKVFRSSGGVRVDFNQDGQEDILWRYYGSGAYQGLNVIWLMAQGGTSSPIPSAKEQTSALGASLLTGATASVVYKTPQGAGPQLVSMPRRALKSVLTGGNAPALKAKQIMKQPIDRDRALSKIDRFRSRARVAMSIPARKDAVDVAALSSGTAKIASISLGTEVVFSQVLDTGWQIAGTGDFNGDGHTDILWRYYGTGAYQGLNDIWFMDGTTFVGEAVFSQVLDTNWRIAGTGDFNGDGETDILWRYYGTGAYQGLNDIWFMDGTTFVSEAVFSQVLDTNWRIEGTGDFNGDGETDILWRYYGTGDYQGLNDIWFMNDSTFQGEAVFSQILDTGWEIGGTGDFNNDGQTDILWRYYGTGAYQGLNDIWYMNGTSFVSEEVFSQVMDTNWRIVNR